MRRPTTKVSTEVLRWRAVDEWNAHFTAQDREANPARANVEAAQITTEDERFLRAIGIARS